MDTQSADAAPQIENKIPARVCSHNGKKFTVAKNLIIAELDEPEAAGLAFYSHAARSPENLLYADEANFSGVGICRQLEFRTSFTKPAFGDTEWRAFYLSAPYELPGLD